MLNDIKATIDLNVLAAMNECAASKEDARYYLCGVLIEVYSQQNIYCATDGHRLLVHRQKFSDTDKETPELIKAVILPSDECKALKPKKSEPTSAALTFETDGYLKVLRQDGSARLFRPIDGTFPDWRRIVPEQVPERKQVNCSNAGQYHHSYKDKLRCTNPLPYVATINKEQGGLIVTCHCGGILTESSHASQFNWDYCAAFQRFAERLGWSRPDIIANGNSPAWVRFQEEDTFGLLMPVRSEPQSIARPEWLKSSNIRAAAAE